MFKLQIRCNYLHSCIFRYFSGFTTYTHRWRNQRHTLGQGRFISIIIIIHSGCQIFSSKYPYFSRIGAKNRHLFLLPRAKKKLPFEKIFIRHWEHSLDMHNQAQRILHFDNYRSFQTDFNPCVLWWLLNRSGKITKTAISNTS